MALAWAACSDPVPETAPDVNAKCPKIAVDNLAGQWVRVAGSSGDTSHRFEVRKKADDTYEATFILGGFQRMLAQGRTHKTSVVFTEQLTGQALKQYEAGQRTKRQLHVEPRIESCSLRMRQIVLQKSGEQEVERNLAGKDEYLPFPEGQPFSFHACTGHLFIGKAALSAKVANWELSTHGAAERSHQLGKKIPLGVWTDAAEDGDASCTFDMDLWFDDRPVKGKQKIPAGPQSKGKRHWLIKEWAAPYSGNHHFLGEWFKTCGGQRERIGVNCLDAVLHP